MKKMKKFKVNVELNEDGKTSPSTIIKVKKILKENNGKSFSIDFDFK